MTNDSIDYIISSLRELTISVGALMDAMILSKTITTEQLQGLRQARSERYDAIMSQEDETDGSK